MDAWERMFREEQETLNFLLREEFREMATTAMAQTTRIIFRCNLCKHVWAYDYRQERGHLLRTWTPAPTDTNQHPFSTPQNDERCPKCHHLNVTYGEVVGKVSQKPCDARCMAATGFVCNCSCGGKNHGKGHMN